MGIGTPVNVDIWYFAYKSPQLVQSDKVSTPRYLSESESALILEDYGKKMTTNFFVRTYTIAKARHLCPANGFRQNRQELTSLVELLFL
jgi:hypothetical protein